MPATSTPEFHLYVHSPTALFKARTNMPGTITYPVTALTFDGVTLGAYTDIEHDMTLLLGTTDGADDLGRTRVQKIATSTSIPVARVSQGVEDGTLTVQDNAYITILLDDIRVWAKLPYQSPDGVDYKDADIPVGTYLTDIPPVANCGPGTAGYTSGGIITVAFDGTGSYAMADGATIATYAWDIGDGTVTVGTLTSSTLTVTFPAGFRWVGLTVVDSNGEPHTARCPVLAVNAAADVTIQKFRVEHRLTQKGSELTFRIFDNLPRTTYPDGTLVMFWWGAAASAGDRSHMKFIGWEHNSDAGSRATRTGLVRETTLTCVDVAGKLDSLPGFPQALQREAEDDVDIMWSLMPGLDMSKALHYLIFWHSTALGVADFFLPDTGTDFPSMRLDSVGATLYDQLNSRALSMTPDHMLVCNPQGQLSFLADWFYMDVGDRPTIASILTEDDWSDLRVDYSRPPRVHVLRSSAVVCSTSWLMLDGEKTLPLAFSVAPGTAFSQGTSEASEAEGLTISQDDLNVATGHRYARLNARFGLARVKLPTPDDVWDYAPALLQRLQLNISAATAAQRGLPFTQVNFMAKSIDLRYNTDKTGTWIDVDLQVELETSGSLALTHVPETTRDLDDYESPPIPGWTPPVDGDPIYYYGDMKAYVLWDGVHVMRTWDLQASSPTWELISTGITGTIWDGQYVHVDQFTVGMWLFTSDAIWWCDDIMAATPVWDDVLTLATVQAADAAPALGDVQFACMYNYGSEPGYLCVATSPDDVGLAYVHAYFWHTHDYGQTWTQVDMDAFTFTSDSITRCYYSAGKFSMNIFRSAPGTIWCLRSTGRTSISTGRTAVFKSEDLGHTWTKEHEFGNWSATHNLGSLLNPFPSITDPSYIARASGSTGTLTLYKSTDAWATASALTPPAGHNGGFGHSNVIQRTNKRTFDNTHVLSLMLINSSSNGDLYESFDQGATWALLENLNNSKATPNGWPPDVDQWVLVDDSATPRIQLTLDNFVTLLDKTGNITTLLSTATPAGWSSAGVANGFALPRVAPNA